MNQNKTLIMLVICACLGEASFIMCVPSGKAWLVERDAAACRLAHLRGWLICGLMCWMGACLGTPGCGFWWATWAAMGVKSLSPCAQDKKKKTAMLSRLAPLEGCFAHMTKALFMDGCEHNNRNSTWRKIEAAGLHQTHLTIFSNCPI